MVQKISLGLAGLIVGVILGILGVNFLPIFPSQEKQAVTSLPIAHQILAPKQVIGFLPYWLLDKAKTDYSPYINTLTYFDLTPDKDGHILKLATPQELEPGWNNLSSGKATPFLEAAKKKGLKLSLLIFSGNNQIIDALVSDPIPHAQNLIADVTPIMKQFGFKDLNLDIEKTNQASPSATINFTKFVQEVKKGVDQNNLGTLTVDVSTGNFVNKELINPQAIEPFADHIVIMTYDYHFIGSLVSGPVAPLNGFGISSEYDVQTAVAEALKQVPAKKLILGAPLYGYEWETINEATRSATIPSTGLTASTQRVEQTLKDCATCSASLDAQAQENYIVYKASDTNTFHQIFYPDQKAMQVKIDFARLNNLGGIALWALGYEASDILEPLKGYK